MDRHLELVPVRRSLLAAASALLALLAVAMPVAAHVDYVTDPADESADAVAFVLSVLTEPVNATLFGGGGVLVLVGAAGYIWARPTVPDLVVLRETLATYRDLVPWMLRLSVGLPLVGAGFQGYLFAPVVSFDPTANPLLRLVFIGVGFCLLFGLATRVVAAAGLALFLLALAVDPGVVLAFEYLPGFVALLVLGGGRPSADDILQDVAGTEGTLYGRIDPVHYAKDRLDAVTDPFRAYVPTVLRVGMGLSFVYLGSTQKLGDPARSLAVVEKYDLTAVVPVDPGLWVVGAGVTEIAVGLALVVGLFTRASAATAFVLFTLTLFGLPDDPVLAHVTLFGMASALFVLGGGPLSLDRRLGQSVTEPGAVAPADD